MAICFYSALTNIFETQIAIMISHELFIKTSATCCNYSWLVNEGKSEMSIICPGGFMRTASAHGAAHLTYRETEIGAQVE